MPRSVRFRMSGGTSCDRCLRALVSALALLATARPAAAVDPATLPAVGAHPASIRYWSNPYLADAFRNGGPWLEYAPGQFGTEVFTAGNAQFDANGLPQYLNPGLQLRALLWGLHTDYANRPSTWPRRSGASVGRVVVTWQGRADIRLNVGTLVASDSSGPATGLLTNGRRSYLLSSSQATGWLDVLAIDATQPITRIHVWLPNPSDPTGAALEGQLFHPHFLARLADAPWGFLRAMNLVETNGSPVQDWADRRLPSHALANGVLHRRSPAPGVGGVTGDRPTGLSYEHLVALCNASGLDLWLNVPHLATDDFVTRLARLVAFGSDGVEPYAAPVPSPVHPPLAAGRRVFLEYSNEIWSSGPSFPQGDWAGLRAGQLGISKAQFVARRTSEVFRIFQSVLGGTSRLVRVAAAFTANESYTQDLLAEMAAYGPTLTPAVEPDVVAVTTYFGNGIQDWAFDRALAAAPTSDRWFLTSATFDPGNGSARPVSVPADDPYWTGSAFGRHLGLAFDEWKRRLLSGEATEGAGPDAVGTAGGFEPWLVDLARTTFPTPKAVVAYEGGPSLYTDDRDWGDGRDDGITTFLEALNRHPRFPEVYRIHLEAALSRGLRSHVAFVDAGDWGRYGQWGHLEVLDQAPASSPKYAFLLDWLGVVGSLRPVHDPAGAVPSFTTPVELPTALWGQPYSASIATTGGDGTRTAVVTGSALRPGLAAAPGAAPGTLVVSGTPTEAGRGFLQARVVDADGDPAWRTFSMRVVGAPGTLFEANLLGSDPGLHLPWGATAFLADGLGYGGWTSGPAASGRAGSDALFWSVSAPADEADATLARAIADGTYLSLVLTPPAGRPLDLRGALFRFTVRRIDYHAPRRFSVLTSVGGFTEGAALMTSERIAEPGDRELEAVFPSTEAYRGLAGPVEIRLYGWSGQYAGHRVALVDASLTVPGSTALRLEPLTPCRIVDTRLTAALGAGETRIVPVSGVCGVPAGTRAAVLNVTAVQAGATGSLALFPDGTAPPGTSTVSFSVGRTRAAFSISGLAADGTIRVHNDSAATVHVVLDVSAAFR